MTRSGYSPGPQSYPVPRILNVTLGSLNLIDSARKIYEKMKKKEKRKERKESRRSVESRVPISKRRERSPRGDRDRVLPLTKEKKGNEKREKEIHSRADLSSPDTIHVDAE